MSRKIFKLALLCGCVSLTASLSACVSVLPDPEPANSIYRLTMTPEKVEPSRTAPIIRIDQPTAARLVGTRKIIVSPDAQRLAVAGGAEWADTLPNMLQKAVVDKLATRPDLNGVMPAAGARANYRVHMNIDAFEARFDNGPEAAPLVMISYSVTFADTATRRLMGTRQFNESIRADSNRISSIVAAMNRANELALSDMTEWFLQLTRSA